MDAVKRTECREGGLDLNWYLGSRRCEGDGVMGDKKIELRELNWVSSSWGSLPR